jgi:hypothetical protein
MTESQGETIPETPQELLERQISPQVQAVIGMARESGLDLYEELLVVDQLLADLEQSFQWFIQQGLEFGQDPPERLLIWKQWSTGLSGLRTSLAPLLRGSLPPES